MADSACTVDVDESLLLTLSTALVVSYHVIIIYNVQVNACETCTCAAVAGAVSFVLSLLEPDPVKRPSVRTAMEERWINEGYAKKPLHTLTYKNRFPFICPCPYVAFLGLCHFVNVSISVLFHRLCVEDLNSSVLAHMTQTLGYALSEIIHTLTTNRPSTITAYYHLLLSKLTGSQKGAKASKVAPHLYPE